MQSELVQDLLNYAEGAWQEDGKRVQLRQIKISEGTDYVL